MASRFGTWWVCSAIREMPITGITQKSNYGDPIVINNPHTII